MITRVCLGSLKSGDNRLGSVDSSPWERKGAVFICFGSMGGGESSSSSVRSITPLFSSELNNNDGELNCARDVRGWVRVILLGVNAEHEATRQRRIATFWIDEAAIVAKLV